MKAAELQIGDWVSYNGKKYQVTYLYCRPLPDGTLPANEVGFTHREDFWIDTGHANPIFLTPEILGQNGFIHEYTECVVSKYYKHIVNEHVSTAINVYFEKDMDVKVLVQIETNLKVVSGVNSFHGCEIEHVHTFQHALRLCGLTELADNFKVEE